MTPNALEQTVIDALEDIKAKDIVVIDVSRMGTLFDTLIIASGDSNRQTRALANSVREKVKEAGHDILGTEGEQEGEWVVVDLGETVVHIMVPAVRQYYNLEQLWGETQNMKRVGTLHTTPPMRYDETEQ